MIRVTFIMPSTDLLPQDVIVGETENPTAWTIDSFVYAVIRAGLDANQLEIIEGDEGLFNLPMMNDPIWSNHDTVPA